MDYEAHNEQVRRVWQAYHEKRPIRVPMVLGISAQWTLSMPEANPQGYTFAEYMTNPEVMIRHQLHKSWWVRHRVLQDAEMGLPQSWPVVVDGQNVFEAGWLGGMISIRPRQPPAAVPVLTDDRKREILDRGIPDPFAGEWAEWNWERYELARQWAEEGVEFHGRPLAQPTPTGTGTDGPFTIACQLRGADNLCMDIYLDPDYFHSLMELITEATIQRVRAYRRHLGLDEETRTWGFADDFVQLLSCETYRDHVLPYHRRLVEAFGRDGPNAIHLCGDATHLFPIIRDELKVQSFDTGYPVDFGRLRRELGADVQILGGPRVDLVRNGPPEAIQAEVRRIMATGVREGGRFILREGNNCAPGTPLDHIAAMYEACQKYGQY
jgi:uroporphyrinogen-III decarboxylase